jgi:very-short-patch-repair endonuclease
MSPATASDIGATTDPRHLDRLLGYYLDCLEAESGQGVRASWCDRGKRWVPYPGPLNRYGNADTSPQLAPESLPTQWNPTITLLYGYPLIVVGAEATSLTHLPVLLQRVDIAPERSQSMFSLVSEAPYLNSELLHYLSKSPEGQRALRTALADGEIAAADPKQLQEILTATCGCPVQEPLRDSVTGDSSELADPGLYNRAGFYLPSQTSYTIGLRRELAALKERRVNTAETALAPLLSLPYSGLPADSTFIQTIPLDRQQRAACEAVWRHRLSVITGPPGTGKSQLILALLGDALCRNRRVLFASKNQRAVATVESRFRKASNRQSLFRAGLRAGADDLRHSFLELLSTLLAQPPATPEVSIHRLHRAYEAACRQRDIVDSKITQLGNGPSPETPNTGPTQRPRPTWFRRLITPNRPSRLLEQPTGSPNPTLLSRASVFSEKAVSNAGARLLSEHVERRHRQLSRLARQILNRYRAALERFIASRSDPSASTLRRRLHAHFSDLLNVFPLWSVTNLSAHTSLPLEPALFDLVVIDEASQSDIASAIPLLYRAKRAVIIGDNQQLRHIATITTATEQELMHRHGLTRRSDEPFGYIYNSVFDLAAAAPDTAVHSLVKNYRSHGHLLAFSNRRWYVNVLEPTVRYSDLLTTDMLTPWHWIDTTSKASTRNDSGVTVEAECVATRRVLQDLFRSGYSGSIGIVTPFRAQAAALLRVAQEFPQVWHEARHLQVSTAHGFQGDERDIVILSLCVADTLPPGAKAFLAANGHLLNVALTRGRAHCVLVGDRQACTRSDIAHYADLAAFEPANRLADAERIGTPQGPDEATLHRALSKLGLHPIAQYPVDQYRVDLAIVSDTHRLAIEIDGAKYHTTDGGFRLHEDLLRDARLRDLGWQVLRFWSEQVRRDLDGCTDTVKQALAPSLIE